MRLRDITMDDLKGMLHMKVDLFSALCAVARRAKKIHKNEEKKALLDQGVLPLRRGDDEAGPSCPAPKPKPKPKPPLPPLPEKPPLPAEFRAAIEEIALAKNAPATEAKLVIQKELYETDLSIGRNCLYIPFNKVENDFLTEEEKQFLLGEDEKRNKLFLEVKIVQPSLKLETVKLCRRDAKTSSSYVIRESWNVIVKKNNLRVKTTVQLWCFRVDRELCFALVRVPRNRAA